MSVDREIPYGSELKMAIMCEERDGRCEISTLLYVVAEINCIWMIPQRLDQSVM